MGEAIAHLAPLEQPVQQIFAIDTSAGYKHVVCIDARPIGQPMLTAEGVFISPVPLTVEVAVVPEASKPAVSEATIAVVALGREARTARREAAKRRLAIEKRLPKLHVALGTFGGRIDAHGR